MAIWHLVAPSGFDLHQVLKWRGRFLLTLAVYYKRAIAPFAIASLLGLAGLLPASARGGIPLEDPWTRRIWRASPRGVRAGIEHSTRFVGPPHLAASYVIWDRWRDVGSWPILLKKSKY